ncbi:hypothetical protein [Myroides odoratimimus]|uniref:hypothetical protein n=1 Tax=Myroides odoratimimus TaxID=76832 RepID=UPI001CE08A16|nr:hypothetical protein [Myroides odoratimimus]MCA4794468.1 hypothetical protein [Myroides odoratimimus]MCA4821728.1 hypothetical protein [Myroides odoratimimus]
MIKSSLLIGVSVLSMLVFAGNYSSVTYATCTGSSNCKACKNCKYFKHCSQKGNSCGVCK